MEARQGENPAKPGFQRSQQPDPHARERAFEMDRHAGPPGVSPEAAAVEIAEIVDGIGDTCPECPPVD
jgi:hypothetical protein